MLFLFLSNQSSVKLHPENFHEYLIVVAILASSSFHSHGMFCSLLMAKERLENNVNKAIHLGFFSFFLSVVGEEEVVAGYGFLYISIILDLLQ